MNNAEQEYYTCFHLQLRNGGFHTGIVHPLTPLRIPARSAEDGKSIPVAVVAMTEAVRRRWKQLEEKAYTICEFFLTNILRNLESRDRHLASQNLIFLVREHICKNLLCFGGRYGCPFWSSILFELSFYNCITRASRSLIRE
ncbi:hypothetical protein F7734_01065 [Scytonema sp. UIC 10036]|uniref:hypothetical protein n=1 Tax=Scytonema sp. UIC 10036 TaxID=2304196 RepID=UPI0012DA31DB|nr:hypothetical protein [Scytonema sp. UIC 10036]MUG91163.1 hypothetical protein [Scytonema sp. UIC 10036]